MPSSTDINGRSFFGFLAMQSPKKISFQIRPARSIPDYLFLRSLRNKVRANMTNDTTAVGYWQQLRFYWRKPRNIEIYVAWAGRRRAGYLLLRRDDSTALITEAVEEHYRGQGAATSMIRFAQEICGDITAEILATNLASIKLHEATGFRHAGEKGNVRILRYRA